MLKSTLINFIKFSARDFIMKYEKYDIEYAIKAFEITDRESMLLSKLYERMVSYRDTIDCEYKSEANFDERCAILGYFIPITKNDIKGYINDSLDNFRLFDCIYDIIFDEKFLSKSGRGVLCHHFGYSDKYEKLAEKETEENLGITRSTYYTTKNTAERKVNDLIKKFKVLAPYYSNKSEYL